MQFQSMPEFPSLSCKLGSQGPVCLPLHVVYSLEDEQKGSEAQSPPVRVDRTSETVCPYG